MVNPDDARPGGLMADANVPADAAGQDAAELRRGSFRASGYEGQSILVCPALDLVVDRGVRIASHQLLIRLAAGYAPADGQPHAQPDQDESGASVQTAANPHVLHPASDLPWNTIVELPVNAPWKQVLVPEAPRSTLKCSATV